MKAKEIIATYGDTAKAMAERFHLRDTLILGVIAQESSGDPDAVSSCGARGLMQLMTPAVIDFNRRFHKEYTFSDMFQAAINIEAGSGYLAMLIQQLGNEVLGIRAYNQGAGRIKRDNLAGKWYSDGVLKHEAEMIEAKNEATPSL